MGESSETWDGIQDPVLTRCWVPLTWAPSRVPGQCRFPTRAIAKNHVPLAVQCMKPRRVTVAKVFSSFL